jgi:hypothetical protein
MSSSICAVFDKQEDALIDRVALAWPSYMNIYHITPRRRRHLAAVEKEVGWPPLLRADTQ